MYRVGGGGGGWARAKETLKQNSVRVKHRRNGDSVRVKHRRHGDSVTRFCSERAVRASAYWQGEGREGEHQVRAWDSPLKNSVRVDHIKGALHPTK